MCSSVIDRDRGTAGSSVELTIGGATVKDQGRGLPRDLTDRIAFLLQIALARAQAMGEQALTGIGVSGREYGVLAVLADRTPTAQYEVGAALGIDRTSTMTLLAALEGRGLVERTRDPANRRAHLVRLTDEGRRLRARAADVLLDCEERFLAPLAVPDREHLRSSLSQLL